MSERPNVVLASLLATAALAAALILTGPACLGGSGVAGPAAVVRGAFSACLIFIDELPHLPLSSLLLFALAVASTLALLHTAAAYLRAARLLKALPLEPVGEGRLRELVREAGADVFVTPDDDGAARAPDDVLHDCNISARFARPR